MNNFFTEDELAKLPKWAQGKLVVIFNELRRLNEENRAMKGEEETNVWWTSHVYKSDKGGTQFKNNFLPNDQEVSFKLLTTTKGRRFLVAVAIRERNGIKQLEIRANEGLVAIHPCAGNAFDLRPVDY
jgi:hypothetical protein